MGTASRGLILAATVAELAGAVVTAAAHGPAIGAAAHGPGSARCCLPAASGHGLRGECAVEQAYTCSHGGPMAGLTRPDFDACLDFLAGDLAAPPGAFEPEPGAAPCWSSPGSGSATAGSGCAAAV